MPGDSHFSSDCHPKRREQMIQNTSNQAGESAVLVAGATGGVGKLVVGLLLERGYRVRAMVRDEAKARRLLDSAVELVLGDVRRPETLAPAMVGIKAVISAIGSYAPLGKNRIKDVDWQGVRNLVEASRAAGVTHFVLLSSTGTTRPEGSFLNFLGGYLVCKAQGEEALRQSELNHTIVRAGRLQDTPGGQSKIAIRQGDTETGKISRADVAAVCVAALEHSATHRTTIEVFAVPGEPVHDWAAQFADLKPDQ